MDHHRYYSTSGYSTIPVSIARSGKKINPKKNKYFSNGSVQFMCESLSELAGSRYSEIKLKDDHAWGHILKYVKTLDKLHKKLKFGSICSRESGNSTGYYFEIYHLLLSHIKVIIMYQ